MDNYTIFRCSKTLVEAGKQEILQQINVPKILDLKSSSEQIFPKIEVGSFVIGSQTVYRLRQQSILNVYFSLFKNTLDM